MGNLPAPFHGFKKRPISNKTIDDYKIQIQTECAYEIAQNILYEHTIHFDVRKGDGMYWFYYFDHNGSRVKVHECFINVDINVSISEQKR